MTGEEFRNLFNVLFNNITSNQAPGLDDYEICVFLTKGLNELMKNYFLAQSNPKLAGFDDNQKRQKDFSNLIVTNWLTGFASPDTYIHPKAMTIDVTSRNNYLFILNELLIYNDSVNWTVVPISFIEFDRLMRKPYKYPPKGLVWRLIYNDACDDPVASNEQYVIIGKFPEEFTLSNFTYVIRYVRKPLPIIISSLKDLNLSIEGYNGTTTDKIVDGTTVSKGNSFYSNGKCCELPEEMHEEILQRAVELAKIAWLGDVQSNMQAGQRSE